jgi:hypothetical protein
MIPVNIPTSAKHLPASGKNVKQMLSDAVMQHFIATTVNKAGVACILCRKLRVLQATVMNKPLQHFVQRRNRHRFFFVHNCCKIVFLDCLNTSCNSAGLACDAEIPAGWLL